MKKITLFFITIFSSILIGMLALNIIYPPTINKAGSSTNTNSQNPTQNSSTSNTNAGSNTNTRSDNNTLTVKNIAQHSSPNDCYLIIKQNVYDVSSYISLHPGGRGTITSRCGREVTSIFASIHSNFAWDLLGKYMIGSVQAGNTNTAKGSNAQQNLDTIQSKITEAYTQAEIVNIKPRSSFYVAKIIDNGKLKELHIDKSGDITNVEVENDEYDWNSWSDDADD